MNDDQSFYEIQLNPLHLVLAVLGVVMVGVTIFWLGVVIGRDQSATAGPSDFASAVPVESGGEQAGESPLEFYEAVNEPMAADTEGAGDPAATSTQTPASDPASSAPAASNASPPAQPEEPPAGGFQAADPVNEQRAPVVVDTDRQSDSGLPRADASLVSGWLIQVRSTPEKAAADALQAALARDGFPAFVTSADVRGQTWYRVRVGRYGSRSDAEAVERALLTRSDIESAWVTEG